MPTTYGPWVQDDDRPEQPRASYWANPDFSRPAGTTFVGGIQVDEPWAAKVDPAEALDVPSWSHSGGVYHLYTDVPVTVGQISEGPVTTADFLRRWNPFGGAGQTPHIETRSSVFWRFMPIQVSDLPNGHPGPTDEPPPGAVSYEIEADAHGDPMPGEWVGTTYDITAQIAVSVRETNQSNQPTFVSGIPFELRTLSPSYFSGPPTDPSGGPIDTLSYPGSAGMGAGGYVGQFSSVGQVLGPQPAPSDWPIDGLGGGEYEQTGQITGVVSTATPLFVLYLNFPLMDTTTDPVPADELGEATYSAHVYQLQITRLYRPPRWRWVYETTGLATVPPLQQRQRAAMHGSHALQARAAKNPNQTFRAKGNL